MFVEVEEISNQMLEEEYDLLLERFREKGYHNDPIKGKDGDIIDADALVCAGLKIIGESIGA